MSAAKQEVAATLSMLSKSLAKERGKTGSGALAFLVSGTWVACKLVRPGTVTSDTSDPNRHCPEAKQMCILISFCFLLLSSNLSTRMCCVAHATDPEFVRNNQSGNMLSQAIPSVASSTDRVSQAKRSQTC